MVLPDLGGWSYTGPMARQLAGTDVAWLVGLAVSAVVFLAVSRSRSETEEAAAVARSEEQLATA
jgi:purine-cytosine permease-like protein